MKYNKNCVRDENTTYLELSHHPQLDMQQILFVRSLFFGLLFFIYILVFTMWHSSVSQIVTGVSY